MSTFYLLPARPFLAGQVADLLNQFFPGLDWDLAARDRLADLVADAARGKPDVFVVFREELPAEELASHALADGYGAESGDEVVEVRPGGRPGDVTARRWRL